MEYQSLYREATLSCPRCCTSLSHGEPSFCGRCEGAWISEQALVERVATMQHAPAEIEWATESRTAITCVVCEEPMTALVVFGVPIDRCRPHGFWFDRDELAQMLYESSQRPRTEARRSAADTEWSSAACVGGDVALDVVGGVAEVAVGGAAEVALEGAASGAAELGAVGVEAAAEITVEVAGGILEAIGELLGGLL